jgi:hypothetical protein
MNCIGEKLFMSIADVMVKDGYRDAGMWEREDVGGQLVLLGRRREFGLVEHRKVKVWVQKVSSEKGSNQELILAEPILAGDGFFWRTPWSKGFF